jgi:hypothetical protein
LFRLDPFSRQNAPPPPFSSANLTDDQKKTLASIRKINDYPIYAMTYYGGYGFDEYIKKGHIQLARPTACIKDGCSCFGALNQAGNRIYGRNLDLTSLYPVLVLYSDPPNGYASVSLNIAVEIELYLDNPTDEHTQWVLEYPYYPFDGMNEYGVCISGLSVTGEKVFDPSKITLGRYEMRRLVLDYARTVDEAIHLIGNYNNSDSDTVHYLVSDAHGDSAIIEYHDGAVQAHRNVGLWQVATNFILRGRDPGSVLGTCWRYDTVYNALQAANGCVSRQMGMDILSLVSRQKVPVGGDTFIYTVWSGVYDMTYGQFDVSPGYLYATKESLKLEMVNDLSVLGARCSSKTLQRGYKCKITVRMANQSPRPSKKTSLLVYLSKKNEVTGDSIVLARRTLPSIEGEQNQTLAVEQKIPKSIAPGLYFLIAVADPQAFNNDPIRANNTGIVSDKVVVQ